MSPDQIQQRFPQGAPAPPDDTRQQRRQAQRDLDHLLIKIVVFVGAACAVVAQSDSVSPSVRVTAAAISAGCLALGALLRPTGVPKPPQNREDGRG